MSEPIEVRVVGAVDTTVKNWDQSAKPPYVKNTTIKTYILDPAGLKNVQIADFEPRRIRMAIIVVDAPVSLLSDPPVNSPDTSTSALAPQGGYLPISLQPAELFGPDAWWLNSLGTITRVTVIKEYC